MNNNNHTTVKFIMHMNKHNYKLNVKETHTGIHCS